MKVSKRCRKCGVDKPFSSFGEKRNVCYRCRDAKRRGNVIPDPRPTAPMFESDCGTESVGYTCDFEITFDEVEIPAASQEVEADDLAKILIVPDCHHPFVDRDAWSLMLRAAHGFKPDIIICLGDFADFYSVSSHSKDPTRVNQLEQEIEATKYALKQLNLVGATDKYFIAGNHEDRLSRYLQEHAPALFDTVRVPDVLGLTELGWNYTPYKDFLRIGKLHFTHDTGTAGANAHRQASGVFQGSVVIGHTHRLAYDVQGNADGPSMVMAMFGWLGDFEAVDYMHKAKSRREWVHGFGVGYLRRSTGIVYLQPVPIVNKTCAVEGKLYL